MTDARRNPNSKHYPAGMDLHTLIYRAGPGGSLHLNPDCAPDGAQRKEALLVPLSHRQGERCEDCWDPEKLVEGEWPDGEPDECHDPTATDTGAQTTLLGSVTATDGGQR